MLSSDKNEHWNCVIRDCENFSKFPLISRLIQIISKILRKGTGDYDNYLFKNFLVIDKKNRFYKDKSV